MSEVKMPPRIGPWHETEMEHPDGTDFVLGFYPDHPCVNAKVVYCQVNDEEPDGYEQDDADDEELDAQWFDIDTGEVDAPACWALIIYPDEDQ